MRPSRIKSVDFLRLKKKMILIICKDLKEIQLSNKVNHQIKSRENKMKMVIEILKVKYNKISLFFNEISLVFYFA
jgi:hypothetical protein